ncbi:MAG: alpha-galactosidase, partial [Clostridia bacterium]|nr:alpha-galactosidase [Clostridia bacterium]
MLTGKNFSYAVYVNGAGLLQKLHYGERISTGDLSYLISHIGNTYVPYREDCNAGMWFDAMPLEYGFYARGDYREPTAIAERGDGASMSRFRYVSYQIFDGVPETEGLPHARNGGQTLSIALKDDFSDIEILLNYTVWDGSDVIVRNAVICNAGKETVMLKKAYSFCMQLPEDGYRVLRLHGAWAKERCPEITDLGHGTVRVQSLRGASSHQMNPFMGILTERCTESEGECYGAQLIYSGSFALTAETNCNGEVRLQGGINEIGFGWELKGGETFTTPQAALCYSARGLGELSRSYADFLREHIVDPKHVFEHRPIVVNNWEATYFDFNNEKLFAIIDEAAPLGIDTFVLDDGWFGKRDSDTSGLGDWKVNDTKLRGGLKTVIDRCKKNGLKFGLWFEPEMISEDSDLYRAHPDWAIQKEGVDPVRGRNQLVLDFTRKEVVDYIFESVSKILSDNDISYVKWDMNRYITECYSQSLSAQKQGEFM